MYLATVRCARVMPSLSNSPWIRGAPHSGLARLISRMRVIVFGAMVFPAGFKRATLPFPEDAKALPMPVDDRAGFDQVPTAPVLIGLFIYVFTREQQHEHPAIMKTKRIVLLFIAPSMLAGCVATQYQKSVSVTRDATGAIVSRTETETVIQPHQQGWPVKFEYLKGVQPGESK